jgi:hypothetical protein
MSLKLEHRVGIRASAETIWEIVSDIGGWAAWNPIYSRAEGVLKIGAPLSLDLVLEGQAMRTIRPVIADWIPNEQIHWRLSLLGGLVATTRYIEIEKLADRSCILYNGEVFGGLLGPSVARRMRPAIRAGFAAMGEAVRVKAEAAATAP